MVVTSPGSPWLAASLSLAPAAEVTWSVNRKLGVWLGPLVQELVSLEDSGFLLTREPGWELFSHLLGLDVTSPGCPQAISCSFIQKRACFLSEHAEFSRASLKEMFLHLLFGAGSLSLCWVLLFSTLFVVVCSSCIFVHAENASRMREAIGTAGDGWVLDPYRFLGAIPL